jgi:hypothetical protein
LVSHRNITQALLNEGANHESLDILIVNSDVMKAMIHKCNQAILIRFLKGLQLSWRKQEVWAFPASSIAIYNKIIQGELDVMQKHCRQPSCTIICKLLIKSFVNAYFNPYAAIIAFAACMPPYF